MTCAAQMEGSVEGEKTEGTGQLRIRKIRDGKTQSFELKICKTGMF